MTDYTTLTKKTLLELAKDHEIKGRYEMTKEELIEALTEHDENVEDEVAESETEEEDAQIEIEDNFDLGQEPTIVFDPKTVKEVKSRYPSLKPRDKETGKVIRKGVKFNNNVPYRRKHYYLDPKVANPEKWTVEYKAAYDTAPPQARAIVAYMAEHKVTSYMKSKIGREIVDAAKNHNFLVTKIDSAMLFAYYRRVLETIGVIYAANFSAEESEEG